jgi:hypothetical protein
MRMLKYTVLLVGLLLAAPVHAAPILAPPEESTVRLLPEYTPCSENGVRYACYSLEQQKMLLKLELDAQAWKTELRLTKDALGELVLERGLVYEQLKLTEANMLLASKHIDELTTQLNSEIKQKNDWRSKAETPVIWPYLVGGIVGVLGLGFGLGAVLAQ